MHLSDVHAFNKVAFSLSFTRAATQIGFSRSAITKKIGRLEQDLGVVLLNRSTRSVSLTEAGRVFHEHTSAIDNIIAQATDVVRGADRQPSGTVAFTIPSSLGTALMPALTTQFQSNWPELNLNIHFDDGLVDLIAGGYDLAIRVSQELSDSNLVARRLASTRQVLAASPAYLDKYGVPTDISQLKDHRWLGLGSTGQKSTIWRLQDQDCIVDVPNTLSIAANNSLALVQAACMGTGIVYLPKICMSNEILQQKLQIILPESSDPQPYSIYAVFPHRNSAAKVKVLVDFIEQELNSLHMID